MTTETAYLRAELIHARGLLAEALGVLAAAETIAPNLARISTVRNLVVKVEKFQMHGVAVLPAGVTPDA